MGSRPGAWALRRWLACSLLPAVATALLAERSLAGDLYRWTDPQGRLHVTDDLSRVPPEHRPLATQPRASDSTWNQIDRAAQVPQSEAETPAARAPDHEVRRHVIPVRRAALELSVVATLNARTRAGFIVDTGATLNTVPRAVVDELGIRIDDTTPVTVVAGISGTPMLVPIVTLDEVSLGGAVVRNVEMAVLDTIGYGLLGMPFFNHFRVETDPAGGSLTLEEIDLSAVDGVYGGYGEGYWRSRFRMTREMLLRVQTARMQLPSTHTGLRNRVAGAEQYWQRQLADLETRASRVGVPRSWRE